MRATIRVEDLKVSVKRVDDVGDRARTPEKVLRSESVKGDLLASEERRFATNAGWRKDTPDWVAEKRRRGLDPRTLRATGHLEQALTTGNDSAIVRSAYNGVLRFGIRLGRSDLYYAQSVAKNKAGKRGRPMVRIDLIAKSTIAGRVEHYIAYGINT